MTLLITAVLFGLGFAYLATQNTLGVTLNAGGYMFPNIPVYIVVLGSLLVGLFLAWFFSSIGWVSSFMTIRHKDSKIKQTENQIAKLENRVQELELENAELQNETPTVVTEEETVTREHRPGLLDRLRHA